VRGGGFRRLRTLNGSAGPSGSWFIGRQCTVVIPNNFSSRLQLFLQRNWGAKSRARWALTAVVRLSTFSLPVLLLLLKSHIVEIFLFIDSTWIPTCDRYLILVPSCIMEDCTWTRRWRIEMMGWGIRVYGLWHCSLHWFYLNPNLQ